MKNLITAIYQQVDNAHAYDTHPTPAPIDATYPYVAYKFMPVDNTEKDRDDFTLELSCWDKADPPSHARVVELAEQVRQAIVNFRHLDEHNLIVVSRPSVGYIPDSDRQIKRYDVTATLLTYRR